MRAFIRLPWTIYRDDPQWVPPLLMQERRRLNFATNPFFQHASMQPFLARRAGRIAGRIAAIVDKRHNEYHGESAGFFGFFECVDETEVAAELLQTAADWLRGQGMTVMRGPFNPSTSDSLGILVDGFGSPPAILMAYNPPYYQRLLEQAGLAKARDLYAYYMHSSESEISPKIARVAAAVRKRQGVSIRGGDPRRIRAEMDLIKLIHNEASGRNWGFVPKTEAELDRMARDLKRLVDPELVLFAFVHGEPAGFSLALPDWNQAFRNLNGRLFPVRVPEAAARSAPHQPAARVHDGGAASFPQPGARRDLLLRDLGARRRQGVAGWRVLLGPGGQRQHAQHSGEHGRAPGTRTYRIYERPL